MSPQDRQGGGIYSHPEDEGLAAERTELAWSRSGLAIMAAGAVISRGLPEVSGVPSRPLVGAGIIALGLGVWGLAWWSARRRAREELSRRPARWGDLAPVALGTAVLGVATVALAMLDPR